MTIGEKSTELGVDLAQIALDANIIKTCTNDGVFKCYCAGGEAQNIYIKDENDIQLSQSYYRYDTTEFTEETPLATIQTDFLAYINGQEFIPNPIPDVVTPKE